MTAPYRAFYRMITSTPLRRSLLATAVVVALAAPLSAQARELANLDVNRPASKQAIDPALALGQRRQGRDALGRETFSWMQRSLPAATKAAAGNDEQLARLHLQSLLGQDKQAADRIGELELRAIDRQPGGARLLQFRPRIGGVAIFREDVALLLDGQDQWIAMRGPLPRNGQSSAKSLPAFALDARAAIAQALRAFDFEAKTALPLQAVERRDEYEVFTADAGVKSASGARVVGEQRAKPVYYRTAEGLLPAWYVETVTADSAAAPEDYYGHVISAVDGQLLFRNNHTAHAQEFSYRVWAEGGADRLPYPSPQGRNAMPDPDGLPSNDAVALVPQELRTLANAPFSQAATDGWLPAGASVTSGNNVNAFADRAEPSGFSTGDLQPTTTAANTFDYSFNTALGPAANPTQTHASTLMMFYWTNWLHDWFYDHGFAEVDGNAQLDNYGRGGLGNDLIRAEAQDYAISNNANMATPSDGASPRMQMGLTDGPPERDNSVDGHTLAHEWGHYLSNRLVGDANGLDTEHAGGMGEGWSDFVALLATVKEEDKLKPGNAGFSGAYGFSAYSDNHTYFGIRRYPYSTNLAKSPLTLRYLTNGVTLSGLAAQPNFGRNGASNAEVHNQGEIWSAALWEVYVALLNDSSRLSFAQAQARMKDYLVGGLKLTPVSPTMTEARDAILATMLARGENQDFALASAAFAKRGLGAGALIPDRYSETMEGVVESKSAGSDIAVAATSLSVPLGCDADAVLDQGEQALLNITVANTGFTDLPAGSVTLSSTNSAISFPQGATVATPAIPLFGTASLSVPIAVSAATAANTALSVTVTPTAPGINEPPGIGRNLVLFINFDESTRSSTTEHFDTPQTNWGNRRDPAGTGNAYWSNRNQGSRKYLHGDDGNSRAVTWIESPTMAVGSAPLVLSLNHRYSFEADENELYDGGLIQISTDGGASWSAIDPNAAGYPVGVLSDCCDNPLAGQRALTDNSPAYPEFSDQTINLGTAYANQSNVKLRFGIATDAAVVRGGWDINSLTVSGVTDTPFNAVASQAPTCAASSYKTLQGAMSGTYYDPARSGEGVLVDFGELGGTPVLFFTWYTYQDGEQKWLVGSTPFALSDTQASVDLIETAGAAFGTAFDPQDVQVTPWGSVAVSFPDCDTMQFSFRKNSGDAGTFSLQRGLERLAGGQCDGLHGGLSGTYYSTERSGEGVLVDFGKVGNQPVQFFTWYTYENGRQRWLVGSQPFAGTEASLGVDLIRTEGGRFGTQFNSEEVSSLNWGRVQQRFINCDTLELTYQPDVGESGTLILNRGLNRLGDGQCR